MQFELVFEDDFRFWANLSEILRLHQTVRETTRPTIMIIRHDFFFFPGNKRYRTKIAPRQLT